MLWRCKAYTWVTFSDLSVSSRGTILAQNLKLLVFTCLIQVRNGKFSLQDGKEKKREYFDISLSSTVPTYAKISKCSPVIVIFISLFSVSSPGETRSDFANSSRLLHWQGASKDEEDRLKTLKTKTKEYFFCTGNENVIFLFACCRSGFLDLPLENKL